MEMKEESGGVTKMRELREEKMITNIETISGTSLYCILEFKAHSNIDKEIATDMGDLIIINPLNQDYYFHHKLISKECLNESLEWNFAYFKKLRLSFQRKFKDVTFKFEYDEEEEEGNLGLFEILFRVESRINVVAFKLTMIKVYVPNLMLFYLDKMITLNKSHKEEIDSLHENIESCKKDKVFAYKQLKEFQEESERREQTMLNKFVLLLNEKKKKIRELNHLLVARQSESSGVKSNNLEEIDGDMLLPRREMTPPIERMEDNPRADSLRKSAEKINSTLSDLFY